MLPSQHGINIKNESSILFYILFFFSFVHSKSSVFGDHFTHSSSPFREVSGSRLPYWTQLDCCNDVLRAPPHGPSLPNPQCSQKFPLTPKAAATPSLLRVLPWLWSQSESQSPPTTHEALQDPHSLTGPFVLPHIHQNTPASGPLHLRCPRPGMLFPQIQHGSLSKSLHQCCLLRLLTAGPGHL